MPDTLRLYHVSPKINRVGIMQLGILPALSQGKRKVSWYVELGAVGWAMAHTSARHHTPADELMICLTEIAGEVLGNTRWTGVYTYERIGIPFAYLSAEHMLRRIEEGMTGNAYPF